MAKTHIARALDTARYAVQYDGHVKRVLSNRRILAWLLKSTVRETMEMSIEEIASCIGEEVEVASVSVEPGETNRTIDVSNSEMILGDNLESDIAYEGKITYDIRFHLNLPHGKDEQIKLLINVEAQKKYNLSYDFATRGVFYAARMISAQKDTEFSKSNYQDIKKVYSIWILMDAPKKIGNMISEYTICKHDIGGVTPENKEAYDKFSVLLIYLNQELDREEKTIFHLLNTLLSTRKKQEEKEKILRESFGIPTETEGGIREEMSQMCNLGEAIEEEAMQKGIERGIERGLEKGMQALIATCKSFGASPEITQQKLMDEFEISEQEAASAIERYWK